MTIMLIQKYSFNAGAVLPIAIVNKIESSRTNTTNTTNTTTSIMSVSYSLIIIIGCYTVSGILVVLVLNTSSSQ